MAELQYITCTDGGSFQITTLPALPTPDSLVTFKHSFSELSSTYKNNLNIGYPLRENLNLSNYYGTMTWKNGGILTINSAMQTLNTPHTCVWSSSELRYDETTYTLTGNVVTVTSNRLAIDSIKGNIYFVNSIKNNVYDFNLVPWMDENNVVGLMELTTNTFYTPSSGTWTAGPLAHIFTIDKSNARFASSGGTETVEIEAETTWTASTPSFVSVSPSTGDTGTTQVTITCPSYSGATRREDVITFTDNDDYTLTFKARQNGNSAGFSNIYLGDNNLLSNTIFLGDNAVNTIYLGEEIIYSNGPFVGLKAAPQSLALNNLITTANITIRSSENWTITDDSGGWLSYSTTTGTTGKTVVTVTASTTQADRTATITVTSANYSATIGVTQKPVYYKDLYVTGAANIVTDFNPYTFYTQNNNYMKIVLCHDYNGSGGSSKYLFNTQTVWFSFENYGTGCYFSFGNNTSVINNNGLPSIRTTNGAANPIELVFTGNSVTATQGEDTQTNTYTGNIPNDNLVFYNTSSSRYYDGHLYGFAVYGQNDVLAHWYVGYDDGVNVGIEDLVTGNKFQPNGSNYTIQCSDLQ